ncbi:hypothetical protein NDU88_004457 [Pleurodeles waltl]|uniref:Uncharacterized protein n=1 Tax=Pleurodeles waltl TaxID=8319 RepID=A0AAV7M9A6_PLEWA|nr:hypothetical protein NDU88_004457 [Pleurodeles waltl]
MKAVSRDVPSELGLHRLERPFLFFCPGGGGGTLARGGGSSEVSPVGLRSPLEEPSVARRSGGPRSAVQSARSGFCPGQDGAREKRLVPGRVRMWRRPLAPAGVRGSEETSFCRPGQWRIARGGHW